MIELHQRNPINTPGAAAYCGITASTLEKLRVYGGGPVFLKVGRRVAYDPADLDVWLASKKRSSTAEDGAPTKCNNRIKA